MGKRKTLFLTIENSTRYLGYFLAGIMTVYALSGSTMIFRETSFLKHGKKSKYIFNISILIVILQYNN